MDRKSSLMSKLFPNKFKLRKTSSSVSLANDEFVMVMMPKCRPSKLKADRRFKSTFHLNDVKCHDEDYVKQGDSFI